MSNRSSKLSGTALASALVSAGLLLGSVAAWADEIPCLAEINDIRVVLNGVDANGDALTEGCDGVELINTNPRRDNTEQTCDSLNSKLNGASAKLASAKLAQNKLDDALLKLEQFRGKVVDLRDQGKLNRDDAEELVGPDGDGGVVKPAIDCVMAL